jgi:riboflavin synthase
MFTGLVESLGTVRRIDRAGSGSRLIIEAPLVAAGVHAGDSVAINGACLTVVEHDQETLLFEAGPETLLRTNLGELKPRDRVNLERALRVGDRLGGHLVQGHIDGTGQIVDCQREGEWQVVWFQCPAALAEQMVPKGSVTVDGVSLTLVEVTANRFSVALIPHTLNNTVLGLKTPGATVNLETDILAKYVWKCLRGGAVSLDSLQRAGFLNQ